MVSPETVKTGSHIMYPIFFFQRENPAIHFPFSLAWLCEVNPKT